MKQANCYENYPAWVIVVSNAVSLLTYFIGAVVMYQAGLWSLIPYLIFIAWLEFRLLKTHCVDCYYYGKYCAFGKGKLSSLFFKKGNPKKFICRKITWKEIVPDFIVSIAPIITGIVLLIVNFKLMLLLLVLSLFLLASVGSALVRGSLACKYCKQRKLGCPAQQLFNKK